MLIYVIKTAYSKHPDYKRLIVGGRFRRQSDKAEKLISALKKEGHRIISPSDDAFAEGNYGDVYRSIEACACTVAFTDAMTFSETRRATELTHSIMVAGLPVFLYTALDDNFNKSRLFNGLGDLPNVYILPADVKSAVQAIRNVKAPAQQIMKGT